MDLLKEEEIPIFSIQLKKSIYKNASLLLRAAMNRNKYGTVSCPKGAYNLIRENLCTYRRNHWRTSEDET